MHYMRQNSGTGAGSGDTVTIGPALDSAGAEYTGLVIGDLTLTKNGTSAAMAANATLTHTSNGFYDLVMIGNNADTVGKLTIRCNKTTYQIPPAKYVVLTAVAYDALVANGTIASTTSGRTIVVDAAGLADANTVKLGPSGSGTAQTARDVGGALPAAPPGAAGLPLVGTHIPSALGANGNIKADVRDLLGTAWLTPAVAGTPDVNIVPFHTGTASTGAAGTITLAAGASATDNVYRYNRIEIVSGTGAGQSRICSAYVGSTKVATIVPNWTTTPDNTSVYRVMFGVGAVDVAMWRTGTPNALVSGRVEVLVGAVTAGVIAAAAFAADYWTTLLSTITGSTLFTGITSLAHWLGLIAGKQTPNSTAQTEMRATGAGSGTYDATTDSQEALRDRGDAAWITATSVTVSDKTGFSLANGSIVTATFGTCDFTSTMKTSIGTAVAASAVASVTGGINTGSGVITTLDALDTAQDTQHGTTQAQVALVKAKTDLIPASPAAVGSAMTLTSGERDSISAALLDLANGVESGKTLRQAMRLMAAALAGKRSNSGTANEQFDAIGSPGTARIVGNADAAGDGTPTLTP